VGEGEAGEKVAEDKQAKWKMPPKGAKSKITFLTFLSSRESSDGQRTMGLEVRVDNLQDEKANRYFDT
jgi:hypothetical protein